MGLISLYHLTKANWSRQKRMVIKPGQVGYQF